MDRAYPFTKSTGNGDKRKPGRFYCHCGVDVPETGMKEHLAGHTAPAYAPHVQDASLVVENAPQEEPLDPCSECGQLFPASEMIPWQAPSGSGLICQECYQAHKERAEESKTVATSPRIQGEEPYDWREAEEERQREFRVAHSEEPIPREISDAEAWQLLAAGLAAQRAQREEDRPITLAHAYPALTRPFPVNLVEIKPGKPQPGEDPRPGPGLRRYARLPGPAG